MIRIGPAGWNYKDWAGIAYPEPKPPRFDPLAWLAAFFDTIEINSSYYGPPAPATARRWIERVAENDRFRFTAKLWKRFTHERGTASCPSSRRAGWARCSCSFPGRSGAPTRTASGSTT